jgi:hypothetical protein
MRCTKKECSGTINRDQKDFFALFVSCLDGRTCFEAKVPHDRTPLESICRTLNNGFDGIVRYVVQPIA